MKKFWLKLKTIPKGIVSVFDMQDVLCFGGLALVGIGLWYWDFRISLVVVGIILMVIGRGVLIVRVGKKQE